MSAVRITPVPTNRDWSSRRDALALWLTRADTLALFWDHGVYPSFSPSQTTRDVENQPP